MRKVNISFEEYYHIYNKSMGGRIIFRDSRDFARFLFLILFLQSPLSVRNTKRHIDHFIKNGDFNVDQKVIDSIIKERTVELIAFALMPNHFHLLVRELEEGGISRYLHRVSSGIAKYTQIKYSHDGHLFRGPFGATLVGTNEQLLYLSSYIHKNPRELKKWRDKESSYLWSSYQDFISRNRWRGLVVPNIILGQFESCDEYHRFVKTSIAKEDKLLD